MRQGKTSLVTEPPDDRTTNEDIESTRLLTLIQDDLHHNKQAQYNIYVSIGTDGLSKEVMKEEMEEMLREKRLLAGKHPG